MKRVESISDLTPADQHLHGRHDECAHTLQATKTQTPHERVTQVMRDIYGEPLTHEQQSTKVVEALREGAVERLRAEFDKDGRGVVRAAYRDHSTEQRFIDAILGTSDQEADKT